MEKFTVILELDEDQVRTIRQYEPAVLESPGSFKEWVEGLVEDEIEFMDEEMNGSDDEDEVWEDDEDEEE